MGLKKAREALNRKLAEDHGAAFQEYVLRNWAEARGLIQDWRDGLKHWESKETFQRAYQDNRMSVRTFGATFKDQYQKKFKSIDVVGTNRFRPDSSYQAVFSRDEQREHADAFREPEETKWYHANRGLDSSAFADPSNFVSRQKKYENGLHDLSASLVSKDIDLFDQIHNKEEGAFFAFLPLPEMEDQALLYTLTRAAKVMKTRAPDFYAKVRGLRAEITRVKLAAEYDMAVGYSAIPVPAAGHGEPKFKLRYGLGHTTKPVEGEQADAKLTVTATEATMKKVNKETYEARQQAGLSYKSILEKAARRAEGNKNEIVIAIRHHNGPFPLYATRKGDVLRVIDIATGAAVETGRSISQRGVMA